MNYNIHPIFVHFPIALLTIYSFIKVLPFNKFFKDGKKTIERTFLFLGVLGAFFALNTGEIAEHIIKRNKDIVEIHSLFAGISTFIFSFLTFLEISNILIKKNYFKGKISYFLSIISDISEKNFLTNTLAIMGLLAIFITGLLGGVIVYGTTADPLAPILLKILGLSL